MRSASGWSRVSAVGRTVTRRSLFVCGCSARRRADDDLNRGARLLDRRVARQPRLGEQPPLPATIDPRRARRRGHVLVDAGRLDLLGEAHRHPDLWREHRHHAGERVVEHSDDCELLSTNAERAPDGGGLAAKLPLPVPIRQHHRPRGSGASSYGRKRPAQACRDAERREVVGGDDLAEHQPRAIAAARRRRTWASSRPRPRTPVSRRDSPGCRAGNWSSRYRRPRRSCRCRPAAMARAPEAAGGAAHRRPRRWPYCTLSRCPVRGWRRRRIPGFGPATAERSACPE